jgi:DNA-binding transcriptional LysR family regulator
MAIELRHLRYFAAVAEAGQVSRAAESLYMTQPALSQALQHLEREVGIELLVRHNHGVALSPAGADVLVEARAAIAAADRLVANAVALRRGRERDLVIGVLPESMAELQLPLATFQRARPDIHVEVRMLDLRDQQSALRRGEVDTALICEPGPDLGFFELAEQPLVLAMATFHPLAQLDAVTIDDLDGERFPGAHPDIAREWLDRFWLTDLRGSRPPLTDVPATNGMQVAAQVISGSCVVTTTAELIDQYARHAAIARPVVGARPLSTGFAWGRRTAALDAFVECLRCTPRTLERRAVEL